MESEIGYDIQFWCPRFREDTELSVWGACSLDVIPPTAMDTLTITEGAGGDSCSVRRRCMSQGEYLSGVSFSDPVLHPMSYKISFSSLGSL